MELDLYHPSGAQNFELAPSVFENIRTAALMYYVDTEENNSSVRPGVRIEQNLYFISQGNALIFPSFTKSSEDLSPLATNTINTVVSTL
jgi:hypothetical protein